MQLYLQWGVGTSAGKGLVRLYLQWGVGTSAGKGVGAAVPAVGCWYQFREGVGVAVPAVGCGYQCREGVWCGCTCSGVWVPVQGRGLVRLYLQWGVGTSSGKGLVWPYLQWGVGTSAGKGFGVAVYTCSGVWVPVQGRGLVWLYLQWGVGTSAGKGVGVAVPAVGCGYQCKEGVGVAVPAVGCGYQCREGVGFCGFCSGVLVPVQGRGLVWLYLQWGVGTSAGKGFGVAVPAVGCWYQCREEGWCGCTCSGVWVPVQGKGLVRLYLQLGVGTSAGKGLVWLYLQWGVGTSAGKGLVWPYLQWGVGTSVGKGVSVAVPAVGCGYRDTSKKIPLDSEADKQIEFKGVDLPDE